jgi:hypothetical protein
MSQRCPNCKLINPPDATQCDCGYNFVTGEFPVSAIHAKEPARGGVAQPSSSSADLLWHRSAIMDKPKPNPATSERVVFVLAAVVLVIKFFNSLMPISESPSPALNALSIAMELLAVIALIGLGVRVLGSQTSGRGKWILVLVVGIIAALGILFIRLSGGPRIVLPSRSSDSSMHLEGLPKRVNELIDSHARLAQSFLATRFAQEIKKAPAQRSLARSDVRDARQTVGQLRDCVGQILKLLAQAKLDGIDLSPAFASNEQVLIRPEVWRAQQQTYTLSYEEFGVIDQHWDDWVGKPFPENETELKPWQREVNQMDTEINAAKQQVQALIDQSKGR